jgi:putative methionine-R-sulfoxide reductase with GAF domain
VQGAEKESYSRSRFLSAQAAQSLQNTASSAKISYQSERNVRFVGFLLYNNKFMQLGRFDSIKIEEYAVIEKR